MCAQRKVVCKKYDCTLCLHLGDLCEEGHLTEAVTHCQVAPAAIQQINLVFFRFLRRDGLQKVLDCPESLHLGEKATSPKQSLTVEWLLQPYSRLIWCFPNVCADMVCKSMTVLVVCICGVLHEERHLTKWLLQQNSRVVESVFCKCVHKQRGCARSMTVLIVCTQGVLHKECHLTKAVT